MASVVGSSPSPRPFATFGRSSHDFGGDFDLFNNYGDSSQGSSSYGHTVDLSSPGDHSMDIFGDFLSHDDMMTGQGFDQHTSLPMSNTTSELGFSMSLDNHVVSSTVVQPSSSRAQSTFFSFQQQSHPPSQEPQQIYSAHRQYPSVTIPTSSQNATWAFPGLSDLDFPNLDTTLVDNSPPASAFSLVPSHHDPWSPIQQRSHCSVGSEVNPFAPASDLRDNYAQSALSWQSSPKFLNVNTPSSTRSPVSTHANLNRAPRQSPTLETQPVLLSGKTPRPPQNRFSVSVNGISSFDFAKPEPESPQQLKSRALSIDHSPQADGLSSPAPSDFVVVNNQGSEKASSPVQPDAKPWSIPSPKGKQTQTQFVTQVFSANEDGSARPSSSGAVRRASGKRAGGRSLGSHLPPDKAARAKQLREEGSCWLCCLQRDSCTPGEVCDRCVKRSQRATLEHGLGCDRTKLTELKAFFIPEVLTRLHEHSALKSWCHQHIRRWLSDPMKLKFHVIWTLPPIECEVYEFEPRTIELLAEYQWRTNPATGRKQRIHKPCPPLAMVHIEHADRQRYERYLTKVVENHLERFSEICFDGLQDDFQGRLLRLMIRLKPENKEEGALLHDIFRLLVVTYIMSRKATLAPSQRRLLTKLRSYPSSPDAYGWATSPRMANRQLKFLWCSLLQSIMDSVLKRLQQILRSSKGGTKWTSAFCAILGLSMCFEYMQRLVHVVCDDPSVKSAADTPLDMECKAEAACRVIDDKFQFVSNLFRWKYHRGFNPLRDWTDEKVQRSLGENGVEFVRGVQGLVIEKYDNYLCERQHVGISADNQEKYTSRLVSRFLLSFWSPQ